MSTTYVNPDSTNSEITQAAVRSMLMQGQAQNGYQTSGYYAGGYATNPFGQSQNVMSMPSTESRANIGYPAQMPAMPQCNPMQSGIAPTWNPGNAAFNQLSQMNAQALAGQNFMMPQQPVMGYSGYPIGVDPNNWIFEYMKNNTASKNSWGENYWTMQKPIEQPPIDWTQKSQPQMGDFYAQYGMNGVPTQQPQPMLPAGFAFPQVQETWLDVAKRNWKNL